MVVHDAELTLFTHTTSLTLRGSIFGPVSSCNRNLNCDVAVVVVTPASFSFQVSCRFRISWQNAEALAIRIWKDSPCRSSGYKGIQKKDVKRGMLARIRTNAKHAAVDRVLQASRPCSQGAILEEVAATSVKSVHRKHLLNSQIHGKHYAHISHHFTISPWQLVTDL